MAKTLVFKSYTEFLARTDKSLNGVSEEFAGEHPEFERDNASNTGSWNCYRCSDCSDCYRCYRCSDCSGCSDCSDCYDCYRCSDCSDCSGCSDCSDCYDCYHCSDCSDCYDCYRCSDCSDCSGAKQKKDLSEKLSIPKIENIHQKVLEAVTAENNELEMATWHTCATTHCRAGWVVVLAGQQGRKLEAETSTAFAARQIYKKSSPINVSYPQFFVSNSKAMEDIIRCAEEEKALSK